MLVRFATLNLWNTDTWPMRRDAACEELSRINADVVALQEVPATGDGPDAAHHIGDQCGYEYVAMRRYPDDPDEGLAFLSRSMLHDVEAGWETRFGALRNRGLCARLSLGVADVIATNVHLAWDSIATREIQIGQIIEWIETRTEEDCYALLCGDFNCPPDSSVYRFLMGQQTIGGKGVTPWHDLARYHAERSGSAPAPTLDFWNNPRWRDTPTLEIPARVDWILLQDVFGRGLPYPTVSDAGVFGTSPTPRARVVPSDHCGVYVDIELHG